MQGDPCDGYGVETRAFRAFCRQLLYSVNDERALRFLRGPLCTGEEGADDVGPIISVPKFLSLFGEGNGGGGRGGGGGGDKGGGSGGGAKGGGGGDAGKILPVKRDINVEGLTDKERVLLTQLRESLFERHAR